MSFWIGKNDPIHIEFQLTLNKVFESLHDISLIYQLIIY